MTEVKWQKLPFSGFAVISSCKATGVLITFALIINPAIFRKNVTYIEHWSIKSEYDPHLSE